MMSSFREISINEKHTFQSSKKISSSYPLLLHTMNIASPSEMRLLSALVLLLFVIGSILVSTGSARCCTGRVNGNTQAGVCAPRSICSQGRPRRRSPRCFGGTWYCIGPVLRCPRNKRFFVTVRGECRRGNDRGRVGPDSPNNIRCCRNSPAPLPPQWSVYDLV